jgi:hypothetical protein
MRNIFIKYFILLWEDIAIEIQSKRQSSSEPHKSQLLLNYFCAIIRSLGSKSVTYLNLLKIDLI